MDAIKYWVYIDTPTKRAVLHKASCGACRDGDGMHGHQQASDCRWEDHFTSRQEAWEYAEKEGARMGVIPTACGLCNPLL